MSDFVAGVEPYHYNPSSAEALSTTSTDTDASSVASRIETPLRTAVLDFIKGRGTTQRKQRLLVLSRCFARPPRTVEDRVLTGTGIFRLKYEINNSGDLFLVGADSLWNAAVEAELRRYELDKSNNTKNSYKPREMCKEQLRLGALESLRRCREEETDSDDLTYVLVARKCKKVPSAEMESIALEGTPIMKLWYALTEDGDLLISKFASSIVHGDTMAPLVSSCFVFASQYSMENPIFTAGTDGKRILVSGVTVAADGVVQRSFPPQGLPQQLRASLIIELEYENRGPNN